MRFVNAAAIDVTTHHGTLNAVTICNGTMFDFCMGDEGLDSWAQYPCFDCFILGN